MTDIQGHEASVDEEGVLKLVDQEGQVLWAAGKVGRVPEELVPWPVEERGGVMKKIKAMVKGSKGSLLHKDVVEGLSTGVGKGMGTLSTSFGKGLESFSQGVETFSRGMEKGVETVSKGVGKGIGTISEQLETGVGKLSGSLGKGLESFSEGVETFSRGMERGVESLSKNMEKSFELVAEKNRRKVGGIIRA